MNGIVVKSDQVFSVSGSVPQDNKAGGGFKISEVRNANSLSEKSPYSGHQASIDKADKQLSVSKFLFALGALLAVAAIAVAMAPVSPAFAIGLGIAAAAALLGSALFAIYNYTTH